MDIRFNALSFCQWSRCWTPQIRLVKVRWTPSMSWMSDTLELFHWGQRYSNWLRTRDLYSVSIVVLFLLLNALSTQAATFLAHDAMQLTGWDQDKSDDPITPRSLTLSTAWYRWRFESLLWAEMKWRIDRTQLLWKAKKKRITSADSYLREETVNLTNIPVLSII